MDIENMYVHVYEMLGLLMWHPSPKECCQRIMLHSEIMAAGRPAEFKFLCFDVSVCVQISLFPMCPHVLDSISPYLHISMFPYFHIFNVSMFPCVSYNVCCCYVFLFLFCLPEIAASGSICSSCIALHGRETSAERNFDSVCKVSPWETSGIWTKMYA